MIVRNNDSNADIDNVLTDEQNIEVSVFDTTLNDFTQKYNYCSIEKVECYKAEGKVTIDIEEDVVAAADNVAEAECLLVTCVCCI